MIARLEAATGGSRELDAGIHEHLGKQDRPQHWRIHADLPLYTTSLDCALSLVPEGWQWEIANNAIERGLDRCLPPNDTVRELGPFAALQMPQPDDVLGGLDWFGPIMVSAAKGATPALALCVAALKARSPAKPSQP